MLLNNIVHISGMKGLYRVLGQAGEGILVECMETSKRIPITNPAAQINNLGRVLIITTDEKHITVRLEEVFHRMHEQSAPPPEAGSSDATLRAYFLKLVPNHNAEKLRMGDIVKIIKWYKFLKDRVDLRRPFVPKGADNSAG